MQGRWYTTGSGGGGDIPGMLMSGIAVIAGAGIAAGIAEAVAALAWDLLIAGMVVVTLAVAALIVLVAHRIRHELAAVPEGQHFLMQVHRQAGTGPRPKAIQQAARQPATVNNYYFGGSHIHHRPAPDTSTATIAVPVISGVITGAGRARAGPRDSRAST